MSLSPSQVLRRVAIFSALTEAEIDSLARRAWFRRFAADSLRFSEGDPCESLFVVVTGQARVFKLSPGGREQVLTLDGPGSSVAELPVFDGGPYPASWVAVGDSEMLFLSRRHCDRLADTRLCCRRHGVSGLNQVGVEVEKTLGRIGRRHGLFLRCSGLDRLAHLSGDAPVARSGGDH